jgi:excisionase family DNA binding protein
MKAAPAQPVEIREVMDIRQAAHYLGVSADSLYRYAATGFIPAFRIGNRWRFRRSRLEEWMDSRSQEAEALAPKLVPAQQKKPARSTRVMSRSSRTGS